MIEQYLNSYLKTNSTDPLVKKYIDYFKVELDWFIYNYGDHVSSSHCRKKKINLKYSLYIQLQYINAAIGHVVQRKDYSNILSSVFFAKTDLLLDLGFNPISTIFQPVGLRQILGDIPSIGFMKHKSEIISKGVFNDLCNKNLFLHLEELKNLFIKKCYQYDFKALLLYTDQYFESKYLIEIFRILKKPSFIFSHGLPAIYSLEVDNRSDYLMVWGERMKQNYINIGFDSNKIFVVGNARYIKIKKTQKLRNTLDNVLIIPCSSLLWHQNEWNTPTLIDRSMIILYLYEVQHVLEGLGVKHARYRPHPSINSKWVNGFIDNNFYQIDKDILNVSLRKSSLVIGATSTVFLEALMLGVNYIVYEPSENGVTIMRDRLVPPFDGSEGVEIAHSESDLKYLIKNNYQVNIDVLDGYMKPLDLSILTSIIQ